MRALDSETMVWLASLLLVGCNMFMAIFILAPDTPPTALEEWILMHKLPQQGVSVLNSTLASQALVAFGDWPQRDENQTTLRKDIQHTSSPKPRNTHPRTLKLLFRPGELQHSDNHRTTSGDALRHCHAGPYLQNPNATNNPFLEWFHNPQQPQWIYVSLPNRANQEWIKTLTKQGFQKVAREPSHNNETNVFTIVQDPLSHLVQDFERTWTHQDSLENHILDLYKGRRRRPLDARLPLQTRHVWDGPVTHIFASIHEALRHIAPSVRTRAPPVGLAWTKPVQWWEEVSLATQQKMCKLMLLDYCCLNLPLPPPCSAVQCALTVTQDRHDQTLVTIHPWMV